MKSKSTLFYSCLFISIVMTSCIDGDSDEKLVERDLDNTRKEIQRTIDSSEAVFQTIIEELVNSPSDLTRIKREFELASLNIEKNIRNNLEKINKLGEEGKITNYEADIWMKEISSTEVMNDYEIITHILDSLEKLE